MQGYLSAVVIQLDPVVAIVKGEIRFVREGGTAGAAEDVAGDVPIANR